MNIISWNLCGLGNDNTQNSLKNLCRKQTPSWVAIYEPKVRSSSLPHRFLHRYDLRLLHENLRISPLRTNIWIFGRTTIIPHATVLLSTDQMVAIRFVDTTHSYTLCFVHAHVSYVRRCLLWADLLSLPSNACLAPLLPVRLRIFGNSSR